MNIRRIVVIVVHGIGEQRRFGSLEEVVLNLVKALRKARPGRQVHIEVYEGDQAERHAAETSWRDSPVRVSWLADGLRMEAVFREVFWADLDYPVSFTRWVRLVRWALTLPGVRIFSLGDGNLGTQEGDPSAHGLLSAPQLSVGRRVWVRLQLGLICCPLFVILIFANVAQTLLKRLSFNLPLNRILYDYLGDILLYQDWLVRGSRVEGLDEKSRVAIRRRMVRTLVRTAAECCGDSARHEGYYLFTHSLGTVAAFNALMEPSHVLPSYLTEEEWNRLPADWKQTRSAGAPAAQAPQRPPWLSERDALSRGKLLEKLQGFLTVGSPLDKFAGLWPAIVPVNEEKPDNDVTWLNVSDVQDIVGAGIDLFDRPVREGGQRVDLAGLGFRLTNWDWVGTPWIFTAHTSYWTTHPGRERLMDRLIPWLERSTFPQPPPDLFGKGAATFVFWISSLLSILLLFVLDTFIVEYLPSVLQPLVDRLGLGVWLNLSLPESLTFWPLLGAIVIASVLGVLGGSLARRAYERARFGKQYVKSFGG